MAGKCPPIAGGHIARSGWSYCVGGFPRGGSPVKEIVEQGRFYGWQGAGLLRLRLCANLGFCAVVCAERECVRAFFGSPERFRSGTAIPQLLFS